MIMWGEMIRYSGTYTDQYELAMAQVYYLSGRKQDKAVFDYFFRKNPFDSGYTIFAGLNDLLDVLENLKFDDDDIAFMREQNHDPEFLEYLKDFKFNGDIYACNEGEIVFGLEPILRVEGTLIEVQIIETLLLNILNFQSLIATKASRMRNAARDHLLLEFGLRRAQGPSGYYATKASIIGGFDSTSHVKAAKDLGLTPSGTMAHSFIQSESDELSAFRKFAEYRPEDCVLLLDTYNTLKSGLPNAITIAKEMEKKGQKLMGVRLDSGDFDYLSRACRKALDEASLPYVKIVASNQLDEFVIDSLIKQEAPIDVFGVGTKLVTGFPDGALDGVYKLSEVNGNPKIKISDNILKISLPHKKQVFRAIDEEGMFLGVDAIGLHDEQDISYIQHPVDPLSSVDITQYKKEPLLTLKMRNGKRTLPSPSIDSIKMYLVNRLSLLPVEYKRFTNPHIYKIGLTENLKMVRDQLIKEHKKK